VIDLHLHTSASDGAHDPDALVRLAREAGVTVLSVTDHDTVAAVAQVVAAGAREQVAVVPGIEITSVLDERDVHILGYFLDVESNRLRSFLVSQRADRIRRARAIAGRLSALGAPIDIEAVLQDVAAAGADRAVARPRLAVELWRAGHVQSPAEAFERWIGEGRPAYEPRSGASPAEVVSVIRESGGLASLAHPGLLGRDEIIPGLIEAGLAAIEVYHGDHDAAQRAHYATLARRHNLAMTGGSDYHGEDGGRHSTLGSVSLPEQEFQRLCARAGGRWP
jgi:hypothetical protein